MRTIQKGNGGWFSSTKKNNKKNNNKKNNNKKNNTNNKKKNTVENNRNLKNSIRKLRQQIDKLKERAKNLLEEIAEHKKKTAEFNRDGKKTEAINEIKKYKRKQSEIEKLTVMIQNLKKLLVELMLEEEKTFTVNNPLRRKTLKRSQGSRNLYSNYNAEYGKLKRELQLPIDATEDDLLKELENPSTAVNKFSESERDLLRELEELEQLEKS